MKRRLKGDAVPSKNLVLQQAPQPGIVYEPCKDNSNPQSAKHLEVSDFVDPADSSSDCGKILFLSYVFR